MASWLNALRLTRRALFGGAARLFKESSVDGVPDFEQMEKHLISADVAPTLAAEWLASIGSAKSRGQFITALTEAMLQSLGAAAPWTWEVQEKPIVVLLVGTNGSGKTTSCAKLGFCAKNNGRQTLLAGADTFRAAGTDQLRIWADRLGCDIVAGRQGADAAAVAYDAVEAAVKRGYDYLFIDTAGRMHTKLPLMTELQKVKRSLAKVKANAPQEVWIVLDASLGQNAIAQARVFHESISLTGAIVTKLDGSSRGGFIFSVYRELGIPVRLIGLGESAEDLEVFDSRQFIHALLNQDEKEDVNLHD